MVTSESKINCLKYSVKENMREEQEGRSREPEDENVYIHVTARSKKKRIAASH